MRVSPRPLPGFLVDVVAVLGASSMAWTAAAAAMRGASASRPIVLAAAALSAIAVGAAVRLGTRTDPRIHQPGLFVVAALAPLGLVALADHRASAIALASIPATITAVVCTILVASVRSARAHGNLDAPERVAIVAGLVASSFAAVVLPFLGWIAAVPLAIGLAMLGGVVVREATRARWLARVHSGSEPGWSIVHESELDTREHVPDATGQPLADAVLTYIAPSPDPYRAGRPHVVARVHSKPEVLVRAPRIRAGKALVAMGVAGSLAMVGAAAASEMDARDHSVARTAVDLDAPSCASARPYFKQRIEQTTNVAWATLVTHAEDPTIAEGEGVLLVLPRSGDVDGEAVLRVANSIPCTGKLALRVEPPRIHSFTVHARLTLAPSADRKAVRIEAERQMAELTDVKAALLVERVGAGADYPTFGWGPNYVLRQLPGVVKAVVHVDGKDEALLEPRELPAVGKLELVDTETGDAL